MRRSVAAALLLVGVLAAIAARPAIHLLSAWRADRRSDLPVAAAGFADDASYLNRTRVAEIVDVSASDGEALRQIRDAFVRARATGTGVSIAGFRHSMGGQTIAANGIVLNMRGTTASGTTRRPSASLSAPARPGTGSSPTSTTSAARWPSCRATPPSASAAPSP